MTLPHQKANGLVRAFKSGSSSRWLAEARPCSEEVKKLPGPCMPVLSSPYKTIPDFYGGIRVDDEVRL